MKKATLIYEPALQGYSLKFDYDASILQFLKKVIPAHKRTSSGPPDWIWYFGSEYFDVVKTLFESYRDKYKHVVYTLRIVSEDEIKKLQEEQSQREKETQNWLPSTRQYSINEELRKFYDLIPHNGKSFDSIREASQSEAAKWYKKALLKYHPDRITQTGLRLEEAEELTRKVNETWSLLKEVYFTK